MSILEKTTLEDAYKDREVEHDQDQDEIQDHIISEENHIDDQDI